MKSTACAGVRPHSASRNDDECKAYQTTWECLKGEMVRCRQNADKECIDALEKW